MKVKRYFASTMRSALEMIKQEQGPDVLILSNRKVDGGVELITADELSDKELMRLSSQPDNAAPNAASDTAEVEQGRTAPKREAVSNLDNGQEFLWTDAGTVDRMREELASLKTLLETQLSGLAWSEFGTRHPLGARLLRVLTRIGICSHLARTLVSQVPDELDYRAGWHRVLALLVLRLQALDDPILKSGGRVALCGPTGVGKTTLTSKLAARYAIKHGADKVAIVSMDDRRLGAHQQMKAFGRLIGTAVFTVRSIAELKGVLNDVAMRRLVLIDTPGLPADDATVHHLLAGLTDADADIQCYNVLAATTDYLATSKSLRATSDMAFTGCMLTKLDEAATLGPSLSAMIEAGLPLAYVSSGQKVPDDLETVDGRALVLRAVEFAKETPQLAEPCTYERAFSV